jgi:hypothetical protein
VVCSVASRELSIYRIEQGLRGRVVVDMLAASPASGRARRGRGNVLLVQAKRMVAIAWSGGSWIGHIASTTAAAFTGTGRRLRRRRSRVWAGRVSGGVAVSLRCSTRSQGVQGGLEVVARRVASGVHARRERHPGLILARDLRRVVVASSTRAGVGGARVVRWRGLTRWPGQGKKEERGGASGWRHGRHGHALACPPLSLGVLCIIKCEREPGDQVG